MSTPAELAPGSQQNETEITSKMTLSEPPLSPNTEAASVKDNNTSQSENNVLIQKPKDDSQKAGDGATPQEIAKMVEEIKPIDTPKEVEEIKPVDMPKEVEEIKPVDMPKEVEETKPEEMSQPSEEIKQIETLKPVEQQKQEESKTGNPETSHQNQGENHTALEGSTVAEPNASTNELNEEISKHNLKALECLAAAEGEEGEPIKELDVDALSKQIIDILNEDRADLDLSKEQLLDKSEDLQNFIAKLVKVLAEKAELCVRLEEQNSALSNQTATLKKVIGITKDLLGLRNMEVERLHDDLKMMEDGINAERKRHDLLLQKLKEAMNLNELLRTEYNNQSQLFSALREKYQEKIELITSENKRLQKLAGENEEGEGEEVEEEENKCPAEKEEPTDVSSNTEIVEQ